MTECVFHDAPDSLKNAVIFEIVEQAYRNRERILIYASGDERAAVLDRLLWIMKQEAFIPHRIFQSYELNQDVPVGIVTTETNPIAARVLIADGHCGLDFVGEFDNVHEFVDHTSPEILEICRKRFSDCRERKIAVRHRKHA